MKQLRITKMTPEEIVHCKKDIQFIKELIHAAKQQNVRVVIGGGYAVDGALRKLTRPHGDIDIQLYGREPNARNVIELLLQNVQPDLLKHIEDRGRKEFYHYFLVRRPDSTAGAEFYYVQVADTPFGDTKLVVKEDGSLTKRHPYDTKEGLLEGVHFEIQNPLTELVDKIYKQTVRKDPALPKHDQDIANLRLLIDKKDEETALAAMSS